MTHLWNYTFHEKLKINPSEHKIMLTEPPMNPKENRERLCEHMFETYAFDQVNVSIQAMLTLYAQGLFTGVVVDTGDGVSHVVRGGAGAPPAGRGGPGRQRALGPRLHPTRARLLCLSRPRLVSHPPRACVRPRRRCPRTSGVASFSPYTSAAARPLSLSSSPSSPRCPCTRASCPRTSSPASTWPAATSPTT